MHSLQRTKKSFITKDVRGMNAIDCLAYHANSTQIACVLCTLTDAEFTQLCTPTAFAMVNTRSYDIFAFVKRLTQCMKPAVWPTFIVPCVHVYFRTAQNSIIDSDFYRMLQQFDPEILKAFQKAIFHDFDPTAWAAKFHASEFQRFLELRSSVKHWNMPLIHSICQRQADSFVSVIIPAAQATFGEHWAASPQYRKWLTTKTPDGKTAIERVSRPIRETFVRLYGGVNLPTLK